MYTALFSIGPFATMNNDANIILNGLIEITDTNSVTKNNFTILNNNRSYIFIWNTAYFSY